MKRRTLAAPLPLATILDPLLRELRGSRTDDEVGLRQIWMDVAGSLAAGHTTDVTLERGELRVRLSPASWAQELKEFESTLLARLRKRTKGSVRRLVIRGDAIRGSATSSRRSSSSDGASLRLESNSPRPIPGSLTQQRPETPAQRHDSSPRHAEDSGQDEQIGENRV